MIALAEIYIALRGTIERACAAHGITAPVHAGDLTEPVVQPSIQIDLDEEQTAQQSVHLDARRLTARIYYYPPDLHRWRMAHYAMRDALRPALYEGLTAGGLFLPAGDGITFEAQDGVLCGTVAYDWLEARDGHGGGEDMDELALALHL